MDSSRPPGEKTPYDPAHAAMRQILRERAQALARPVESAPTQGSLLDLLEIRLSNESYAIQTSYVREVQPLKEVTPLPGTPPFLVGIVNVRGEILPVYDLKKLLGLPEIGMADLKRIIIVHGAGIEVGVLADVVVGARSIELGTLEPDSSNLDALKSEYAMGVTDERLVVLDIQRVLSDPKMVIHHKIEH